MGTLFVSPGQVSVDAAASGLVIGVVGIVEAESFEWTPMSLDGVEPAGVGRCGYQRDSVLSSELLKCLMTVRGEVVLNQVEARGHRIAGAQSLPGDQEIVAGFAFVNGARQAVAVNIVKPQELLGALGSSVGGTPALRMLTFRPNGAGHRFEFHGTEFVETDDSAVRRCLGIKPQDTVFFDSNAGSGDSFQVLVR